MELLVLYPQSFPRVQSQFLVFTIRGKYITLLASAGLFKGGNLVA